MKNLKHLILGLILTIGFASNGYAQLVADAIQDGVVIGSVHTYDVTNDATRSWDWSVVDIDDKPILAGALTYEIVDAPNGYTRQIKWNGAGTYYLKVVETITATSCSNYSVVEVKVIGDSYSVQFVSVDTPSNSVYCADDSALGSPEITLNVQLGSGAPADKYYPMQVYYSLDGGATELDTPITNTNTFNLGAVDIGTDLTAPNTTSLTVTLLRIVDANGVIFNPADADKEFTITVNPLPVKPTINF